MQDSAEIKSLLQLENQEIVCGLADARLKVLSFPCLKLQNSKNATEQNVHPSNSIKPF